MHLEAIEQLELELILEAIYRRRGYDFRNYARASLSRRLAEAAKKAGVQHYSDLIGRLLHDDAFFAGFLSGIFVSVTEFFRDTDFFRGLREHVVPFLKTYPRPKIWHAGCATGEEVYSLAIILAEEGLLSRSRIYATDINLDALQRGKSGVYLASDLEDSDRAYAASGGCGRLSDFYVENSSDEAFSRSLVMMNRTLRDNITWSHHDLCTDGLFSEINLVLCRNTLIYFNRGLQDQVLDLLRRSLSIGGVLCLGSKECLDFSSHVGCFEAVSRDLRIYKKREGTARIRERRVG